MKLTHKTLRHCCTACGPCLLWNNGVNGDGYPQARIHGTTETMVRRYVFTKLMRKTIPPGAVVSTRCGHKLCLAGRCLFATSRGGALQAAYANGRRVTAGDYSARLRNASVFAYGDAA